VTVQGQSLTLTAATTTKPFAMSMNVSGDALGGTMTMFLVKGVVYMSAPGETPAGKYVVLDLRNDKNPQLRAIGQMLANADPLKQFRSWKAGGQTVKFVGTEKIGDRAVEHYRVSMILAKKTIVFEMWLGADKLPYKMSYTFLGMDYLAAIGDYNTVAPIAAPPASKIVKQR
jgi:hypothetical protein